MDASRRAAVHMPRRARHGFPCQAVQIYWLQSPHIVSPVGPGCGAGCTVQRLGDVQLHAKCTKALVHPAGNAPMS